MGEWGTVLREQAQLVCVHVQEEEPPPAQQEEQAAGFLQRAKEALLSRDDLQRWQSVASSIRDCLQHVGPWGLGDFAFGLCVYSILLP